MVTPTQAQRTRITRRFLTPGPLRHGDLRKLMVRPPSWPYFLRSWDATGSLFVLVGAVVSSQENAIRESVVVLSEFFVGEGTLGETLTRVANLACVSVGPAGMDGVTMLAEGRVVT